nr:YihY family inner membrane protein [Candidimonas nitroreducens]
MTNAPTPQTRTEALPPAADGSGAAPHGAGAGPSPGTDMPGAAVPGNRAADSAAPWIPAHDEHPPPGLRDLPWSQRAVKVLRYAARRAADQNLTQTASSLTFTTVLAIVPMLAVVLSLFTAFPLFSDFRQALEDFLANNLMPATVSDTVMKYLNMFAAQASRLTAIGGVFLIVTSISLIMTIDRALNNIWNVRNQRPLGQRILMYWAIISLGPVLVGASLWATSFLARESLGRVAEVPAVIGLALSFVPVAATGLGFTVLFSMVPNREVRWKDAMAGGFGTAIVLEIMKAGFAYYLTRFPSYTVIYGAFATVPIFLLWIYMSWLAVLFGAAVAATLPLLRLRRWAEHPAPGAAFMNAMGVLAQLHAARNGPEPGRSMQFLSNHLHVTQEELLPVLDALTQLGYVAQTRDKSGRWMLACDPRQAQLGSVVDALLIDRRHSGLELHPRLQQALADTFAPPLDRDLPLEDILGAGASEPDAQGAA